MILSELLEGVETVSTTGPLDVEISGITNDSRRVGRGGLFAAVRGEVSDGHGFVSDALDRGAAAVVVEELPAVDGACGAAMIEVEDTSGALARIASNYYGNPTSHLTLLGITGTNGKTTVSYLIESVWRAQGINPGVIGTVESRFGGEARPAALTTPDSPELMALFADMLAAGVASVVMEVSSHALVRRRVEGCSFDAAAFTNLTQDHMDFHGTMEDYFLSKRRLFDELLRGSDKTRRYAIINTDDQYGERLMQGSGAEVVTYSLEEPRADVRCAEYSIDKSAVRAVVETPWGLVEVDSPLFGEHNLYNILCAIACTGALGAPAGRIEEGINAARSIPGRLERIENPLGLDVFVDYAHTPDALENVLRSLAPHTAGRLILVFGCGGDRDRGKRPLMGSTGRAHSDVLIVTSDNPRTEDPLDIIEHIEAGLGDTAASGKPYIRIPDRREAITEAISMARAGDTVLIAGKGHEDYQILGTGKHHFDDREVARDVISTIAR